MGSSPTGLDSVIIPLITGESVLDAACGVGRWGSLIASNYWEAGLRSPPAVDGFDATESFVAMHRARGIYRSVWHHLLPEPIRGRWDTVLACELVEHLPPETVGETVAMLEGCAAKRIIFSTPNFPCLRTSEENPYDSHLGYVPAGFFKKRGYRLVGVGWPNPAIRGTKILRALGLDFLFQGFPAKFPFTGIQLVAFKDVG